MKILGKIIFIISLLPFVVLVAMIVVALLSQPIGWLLFIPLLIYVYVCIKSCLEHHPTKGQQEKFEKYYDDWVNIRRK